jgi:predicted nucleic acid-binding protein
MNYTTAKAFVDSNILIYAYDVDAGDKHSKAEELLQELWERRAGVVSTQVLQEFYVNVTRRLKSPVPRTGPI